MLFYNSLLILSIILIIFEKFIQSVNMNESWRQGIIMVLEGIAIGTFIFVTFLEVYY